jgi:hypothetical protein
MSRFSTLAGLVLATLALHGQPGGSSDGRNWCRRCGGVNVCHSWCGKR